VEQDEARGSGDGEVVGDVTALLHAAHAGDSSANEALFRIVYGDLKRIARRQLGRRDAAATLTTTALVHEAYLRLARPGSLDLNDRTHFFSLAARAMRQILVDHARKRTAEKRGGGALALELDEGRVGVADDRADVLVALDDALAKLECVDERLARLVEWRFFGGMTFEEAAVGSGVSDRTLKRDWKRAKAFLYRELSQQGVSP
jgi:RNA polymerase sigma factor (TIGR02999 family)